MVAKGYGFTIKLISETINVLDEKHENYSVNTRFQ